MFLHYWLLNEKPHSAGYIPKLYINNDEWQPDVCKSQIEKDLQNFVKTVKRWMLERKNNSQNLIFYQQHALHHLMSDPRFRIVDSDKNIGPFILEILLYIKLQYHGGHVIARVQGCLRDKVVFVVSIAKLHLELFPCLFRRQASLPFSTGKWDDPCCQDQKESNVDILGFSIGLPPAAA
jgi:hypothetical protein